MREMVLTSERFKNTHKRGAEFKRITKDAQLLRHAMGHKLDGVICITLNGRVNGFIHAVLQDDKVNRFGSRCTASGDVGLLPPRKLLISESSVVVL